MADSGSKPLAETDRPPAWRHYTWAALIALLPCAMVFTVVDPWPQDLAYHEFADRRSWLGIPHFANVISNLPFVVVGVFVLWHVAAAARRARPPGERVAQLVFFASILLTGMGSAWYHLQPSNHSLVWDRLPMSVGFMALLSMLISERVSARWGTRLLAPLCLLGVASVVWWAMKDDLRLYAIVQFYPMLIIVLMLLRLSSRHSHGNRYWGVLAWYALAKVCEAADGWLLQTLHVISGHSLKHLFAALAAWWLLRMLQLRSVDPRQR